MNMQSLPKQDLPQYLAKAKEILSGSLFIPAQNIPDNADISSLGELDSLTFELIVLEIEKNIGREADPIALLELRTVNDIAILLQEESL